MQDTLHVLGISGSPVKDGNTDALLGKALSALAQEPGISMQTIHLSEGEVSGCRHCNWCLRKQTQQQFCSIADSMTAIYPAILRADVIILATPVHIGRMSGILTNMIDRLRAFTYGNVYGGRLKDKIGGALIVAYRRHGGLEITLNMLNYTFSVFSMIPVGRGGLVLSSVEGKGTTDKRIRHMVLEDEFGLASAAEVIRRSVELARIVRAGKRALGMPI